VNADNLDLNSAQKASQPRGLAPQRRTPVTRAPFPLQVKLRNMVISALKLYLWFA
jgi:hypothetical protein